MKAKLLKLIISKLVGRNFNWLRFWSQFETEIDWTDIKTVRKFSYLKKSIIPKVRALINGRLFNTEGYEKPNTILEA